MHLGTKSLRVAHEPRRCQPDRRVAQRVAFDAGWVRWYPAFPPVGEGVLPYRRSARCAVRRFAAARHGFRAGSVRTRFHVARTINPCPKTIYVPLNRQRHHPFVAPAFISAGRESGGQTGRYRLSTQRRYRLARRLLRGSPDPAYLPGGKIEKIESPTLLFDRRPGGPSRTSQVPPWPNLAPPTDAVHEYTCERPRVKTDSGRSRRGAIFFGHRTVQARRRAESEAGRSVDIRPADVQTSP